MSTEVLLPSLMHTMKTAPMSAVARTGLSILVADRDAEAADVLAALLRRWGHDAHVATTAQHALEIAHSVRPRVALVETSRPELEGLGLARRLRASTTLVAMTANQTGTHLRDCLCAGYLFHIAKPADPRVLQPLLEGLRKPCTLDFTPARAPQAAPVPVVMGASAAVLSHA